MIFITLHSCSYWSLCIYDKFQRKLQFMFDTSSDIQFILNPILNRTQKSSEC